MPGAYVPYKVFKGGLTYLQLTSICMSIERDTYRYMNDGESKCQGVLTIGEFR